MCAVRDGARLTASREPFVNICPTRADVACVPVNHRRWEKRIQNKRKHQPYHSPWRSCFAGEKKLQSGQVTDYLTFKTQREAKYEGEHKSVAASVCLGTRSLLFGLDPVSEQRSVMFIPGLFFFSRTNLFIEGQHVDWTAVRATGMAGDALCYSHRGRSNYSLVNLWEQKVKCGISESMCEAQAGSECETVSKWWLVLSPGQTLNKIS